MVKRILITVLLVLFSWIAYKLITNKPNEYYKVDNSLYGFWIPEKIEWECDSDTPIMNTLDITYRCGASFYYYYIDSNCIVKLWSSVSHNRLSDSMTIGVDGSCNEIYRSDSFKIDKKNDTIVLINKIRYKRCYKFDSYSLKEGIECSCINR